MTPRDRESCTKRCPKNPIFLYYWGSPTRSKSRKKEQVLVVFLSVLMENSGNGVFNRVNLGVASGAVETAATRLRNEYWSEFQWWFLLGNHNHQACCFSNDVSVWVAPSRFEAESQEALHINAEKHSMNKDNGLELNPIWFSPLPLTPFVVFRKALLTLSLSYQLGTYSLSFFSSFPLVS